MRAAASAVVYLVPLVFVAGLPLFVDVIDRNARAQEVPPEFVRWTDLWLELTSILRSYAHVAAGSGVVVGILLFVAAAFLMRGSEAGRRATRWFLVAAAAHTVLATAWTCALVLGPMAGWTQRYAKSLSELQDAVPGIEHRFPFAFGGIDWPRVALCVCVGLMTLALDALLFWLAGRPFAHGWCAARAARHPVATPGA